MPKSESRKGTARVCLSRREVQCYQMLADGKAPKQIAADLQISESAVRLYISSGRRKLSAKNTVHAVSRAIALGLIPAF